MTEKEKQQAGELYLSADSELTAERVKAKKLCAEYNAIEYNDYQKKERLLDRLLALRGENTIIEPNFFCDYGYNIITTGDEGKPHCYHFYVYDNTSVTGTNNATGSYDYWVPEEFQADVSSYNRAFPTGWVTTYLPFDWTLPDGCDAYQAADKLVDVNDKGQNVFTFTQVSGTAMKANTPYLLNNKSGNTVSIADAKGLTIPISVRPPYMTFLKDDHTTNALFWGTTEDIPNDSAAVNYQAYNIRPDQKWGKVVTSVPTGYIGHFRAFVSDTRTTTSSSAKPNVVLMLIGKNGETTSISTVDTDAVIGGQAAIYALDGSYMGTDFTRLPNGIYIKNGKKFTVKNR